MDPASMRAERIHVDDWQEVYRLEDPDGFVALHRVIEGRAFGGTRIRAYESPNEALADVRRLSSAMTKKCAINRLPGGGGKAVLEATSITDRERALDSYGAFVESLGGRFYTGPDLGIGPSDIAIIARRTAHVAHQDLSPAAAAGVYWSMRGAVEAVLERDSLSGVTVGLQGLGAVGWKLAELLIADGARVTAYESDPAVVERAHQDLPVGLVDSERQILERDADVLAPCAVGQVIRSDNLDRIRARILCGAANNQLASDDLDVPLAARGITYVPDFVANSGATVQGVLAAVRGAGDYSTQVMDLRRITTELIAEARRERTTPMAVAAARIGGR